MAKPYVDTTGNITIGIGHNLTANGLPDFLIDALYEWDVAQTLPALQAALPWITALNEVRQRVLADMAFNMGVAGLLTFHTFLAHLNAGRFEEAAVAMLDSRWARQVGDRAERLATMIRTGRDL
jgi:lysozyme